MRNRGSDPAMWIFLSGLIFVSLCCPLLTFAQGQQPLVQIDFENQSGSSNPGLCDFSSPPLQILSATFSGGVVLPQGGWSGDPTSVYWVACFPTLPISDLPCGDGGFRFQINFSQKVSNFSVLLLNGWNSPTTFTVCDDQGGQQQITLGPYPTGGAVGTISLPDNNIGQVIVSGGSDFAIDNVQFRPMGPVFLDPVDSGYLNGGSQVCGSLSLPACEDQMASGGVPITAIAAGAACVPPPVNTCTGVTQAVVRIPANFVGETLKVTVQDEDGNPCSGDNGVANDGGVFTLGDSSGSADCNVDVTAVATTSDGPMAFVVYLSPVNYARNSGDYNSSSRAISLQIKSDDDPNYILTANASVVRPPVILVHGLWGSAGDWGRQGFSLSAIDGIDVDTVDYYYPVLQGDQIQATNPPYDQGYLNGIPTSALGFSYNAPLVDGEIRQGIADFRHINNAAAVTADVVAHSMGGDIARTMALGSGFQSNDTYGHGPIDKLITIGTPHLGSPLAADLLQDANKCVRQQLAKKVNPSFITVTTSAGTINGAVGDLQGDGFGGGLSPALQQLSDAGPLPFAMARISAITHGGNNLSDLNCSIFNLDCLAAELKFACGNAPLALALNPAGWDTVFGQYNDAVVPILSQLNGGTAHPQTLTGVIHSPGLETLNFLPPTELDPNSGVPTTVLNLLNEPPNGCDFQGGC